MLFSIKTYESYDLLFSFDRQDRQNQCDDAFSNGIIFSVSEMYK
jgi:hypothetical protein